MCLRTDRLTEQAAKLRLVAVTASGAAIMGRSMQHEGYSCSGSDKWEFCNPSHSHGLKLILATNPWVEELLYSQL